MFTKDMLGALEGALTLYREARHDNTTAPAAYGAAARRIMDELRVNLRTACLLLDSALSVEGLGSSLRNCDGRRH